MRDREQLQRGFDILTNDKLTGGLAKREATNYMREPSKVWDKLNSDAGQGEPAAKGLLEQHKAQSTNQGTCDLSRTNFQTRSRRMTKGIDQIAPAQEVCDSKPPMSHASSKHSQSKKSAH